MGKTAQAGDKFDSKIWSALAPVRGNPIAGHMQQLWEEEKKEEKKNILNVWKQSVQKLKLAPFGKNPENDDHQILVESAQDKEIDKFEYITPFSIRYINIPRHRKIISMESFPTNHFPLYQLHKG